MKRLIFLMSLMLAPASALGKDKRQPQGAPGLTRNRKVGLTGARERAIEMAYLDWNA
jgi:hypothetical protein